VNLRGRVLGGAIAAFAAFLACGGVTLTERSAGDGGGGGSDAGGVARDAPGTTSVEGTFDGVPVVVQGAWAAVYQPVPGSHWVRIYLIDRPGDCSYEGTTVHASSTELHLFVLESASGPEIVPGRYTTDGPDASGAPFAGLFFHSYDAQCTETVFTDGTGFLELDAIGDTVSGSFEMTMTGSHTGNIHGSFVAPRCPLEPAPDAAIAASDAGWVCVR
jgi:hypothetical protein